MCVFLIITTSDNTSYYYQIAIDINRMLILLGSWRVHLILLESISCEVKAYRGREVIEI
jgi:hypothetical protein